MPDKDTLNHICLRANYLAYCQKNFHLSRHPSPIGNGWGIIDGKCRPVRNVYLHCQPVYHHGVHRVIKTAVIVSEDIDDCSETDSTESENDD